jgi:NADP-dependent 3-hydroxy acid dehydrogenase YdfG
MFKNKTLLITGGTGSFGNAVLRRFLKADTSWSVSSLAKRKIVWLALSNACLSGAAVLPPTSKLEAENVRLSGFRNAIVMII